MVNMLLYVDRVTQEAKDLGYDPNKTKMTIYTYMDHDMQEYLDDVSSGKNYKFTDSEMQANASVLESKTGRIIGLMSAKNYRANNSDATYLDYAYTLKNKDSQVLLSNLFLTMQLHLNISTGLLDIQ